ncbi:MAG TPA: hypothetical protein VHX38_32510 [Pseudonocardiaceae bacterium]|jgi:hypothetical protein|nr:hypothetical protein [Pseudonocardiaceae bacterium]
MPRLLSRALLVLGGATAATAAAWLLSSATASADTLPTVVSSGQAAIVAPATSPVAHDTMPGSLDSGSLNSGNVLPSKENGANKPSETELSAAVSTVSDPVTDAGSTAVDAVTEPSQHAELPLPASLPSVPSANPAGLDQLTNGLSAAVGQLGGRLPVSHDLPTQLIGHLGRGAVSTPAAPATPAQPTVAGKYRPTVRDFPFAAGQHGKLAGVTGRDLSRPATGSLPLAPGTPGSSPLTVPVMPGSGGGSGNGFAAPAGLGLTAGNGSQILPEPHVVDVFSPATEPASVMPGKQPGVTPD